MGRPEMSRADLLLPLLIATAAAIFGHFSGRAEAKRMRHLRDDILAGKPRVHLVVLFVFVMILASSVF